LLCGYLDTVGLAGTRGAYDMKAGLAAALIACRDAALASIDAAVVT
jgi:acetylornithine deacetylase